MSCLPFLWCWPWLLWLLCWPWDGGVLILPGLCWLLSLHCWPARREMPLLYICRGRSGGTVLMHKKHSFCLNTKSQFFWCYFCHVFSSREKFNRFMGKTLTLGLTLFLTLCMDIPVAGGRKDGDSGPNKRSSRSSDSKSGRCSYTFIVPQQKLTGALCVNTQFAATNHSEVAVLQAELKSQQEQLEKLRGKLEQEVDLTTEIRALRKETNSVNSRIAQLYAQLLQEVIHKKDQALEQQRVENLLLNVTTQVSRQLSVWDTCVMYSYWSPHYICWVP